MPTSFDRLGGFSGGVSLAEPPLPASSLTRNTRNTQGGVTGVVVMGVVLVHNTQRDPGSIMQLSAAVEFAR